MFRTPRSKQAVFHIRFRTPRSKHVVLEIHLFEFIALNMLSSFQCFERLVLIMLFFRSQPVSFCGRFGSSVVRASRCHGNMWQLLLGVRLGHNALCARAVSAQGQLVGGAIDRRCRDVEWEVDRAGDQHVDVAELPQQSTRIAD